MNANNETKSFTELNMNELIQFLTNKVMERFTAEGDEPIEEWVESVGSEVDDYIDTVLKQGIFDEKNLSWLYGTTMLTAVIFGLPPLMYHMLICRHWDGRGVDFAEHWCNDFIEVIRNPYPEDK